jgi:hypothetical protein
VRAPLRYRAALMAYPGSYRELRGPELFATLADGDDDRGHASTREALALAYRGLLLRTRLLGTAEGLLVAAAVTILIAMLGGFTWAERVYLLDGEAAAWGTEGPGTWPAYPLAVCALLIVAAGRFGVFEKEWRWRSMLLLASLLPLAFIVAPGELIHLALRDPGSLPQFFEWRGRILIDVDGTWWRTAELVGIGFALIVLARLLLSRRTPAVRRRALGAALAVMSAVTIVQTWTRPDLPAEYGQSAFADLEAAAFITMAGLLLALAAGGRAALRRRGWDSNPRGT